MQNVGFAPLRPTFEKLLTGAKVRPKEKKIGVGRKSVYEIDPRTGFMDIFNRKSNV